MLEQRRQHPFFKAAGEAAIGNEREYSRRQVLRHLHDRVIEEIAVVENNAFIKDVASECSQSVTRKKEDQSIVRRCISEEIPKCGRYIG
ncbi:hypothetical protein AJ88_23640 [Mesorhizobium amorphae CCBAU 01583]|nr:hypothetical protein AJ88_23640 [Mesorhizobium amorphae CCBAU 01583]